jgi:chemotaxis protein MotC
MAKRLPTMDREVWKEPRNISAAIIYVLSGGAPKVLSLLLERGDVPPERLDLAKGALA